MRLSGSQPKSLKFQLIQAGSVRRCAVAQLRASAGSTRGDPAVLVVDRAQLHRDARAVGAPVHGVAAAVVALGEHAHGAVALQRIELLRRAQRRQRIDGDAGQRVERQIGATLAVGEVHQHAGLRRSAGCGRRACARPRIPRSPIRSRTCGILPTRPASPPFGEVTTSSQRPSGDSTVRVDLDRVAEVDRARGAVRIGARRRAPSARSASRSAFCRASVCDQAQLHVAQRVGGGGASGSFSATGSATGAARRVAPGPTRTSRCRRGTARARPSAGVLRRRLRPRRCG